TAHGSPPQAPACRTSFSSSGLRPGGARGGADDRRRLLLRQHVGAHDQVVVRLLLLIDVVEAPEVVLTVAVGLPDRGRSGGPLEATGPRARSGSPARRPRRSR